MLNSYAKELCSVDLPYAGRQLYMHTFTTDRVCMPEGFEDYADVVSALLDSAGYSGEAHMTVDEKVFTGTQRRPRAHVDGWYYKSLGRWGGGGWRSHRTERMPIIVAASVPGCAVYEGVFDGEPEEGGDLEHIREQFTHSNVLPANRGFWLSPDCVHESLPFAEPTKRTFLRLALGAAK